MLGVPGLELFGVVHSAFGLIALALGLVTLLMRKGTARHRLVGYGYVIAMVLLNGTAFWIYDLYGRFGPFHGAAMVSLATIGAGFVPVFLRRPRTEWMSLHAHFMSWSYVGLVAAFIAEIATRVPGVGFGTGVIGTLILAVAGGAILIHTQLPRLVPRVAAGYHVMRN